MYQEKAPEAATVYKKSYHDFKGVDLTSAVTEVDDARSPYAPNMIADMAGFPQKRTGYSVLATLGSRINGIHQYIKADGTKKIAVHSGTTLYDFTSGTAVSIKTGLKDARSTSFVYSGKLYLLDGENYLVWDGATVTDVTANAYIPTTAIAMPPTGGGTDHDPVNLLSNKRINSFLATASATQFQLDASGIDAVIKAEIMNSSGSFVETTAYTVNLASGIVTFAAAPGASPVTGEDNVRITFQKTVTGYADRIKQCRINTMFGIGNDTRVFLSGNPNYRNYYWWCSTGRADYFPDVNYNIVGSEAGAVMGYLKQYDNLVVVKEPNGQDASIFLRSATLNEKNEATFITKQGLTGVGACSMYGFNTLVDDNIFLSKDGVYGLDTSSVTQQKTTQIRSYYVNASLTKEAGLDESVSCVNEGYYYLLVLYLP